MGLLPWAFGFLMILAALIASQAREAEESEAIFRVLITSVNQSSKTLTDEISKQAEIEFQIRAGEDAVEDESEEEDPSKRRKRTRGKALTRYLHISQLFTQKGGGQKETQEKLLNGLLRALYGRIPFFDRNEGDEALHQFYVLLQKKAFELEDRFPMKKAAYLANLELENDSLQYVLYRILKGGDGEIAGEKHHIEPLLKYITVRGRQQCMSVYHAPRPLLFALFESPETVDEVIEFRNDVYKRLKERDKDIALQPGEKPMEEIFEAQFREKFESSIMMGIDHTLIDFSVNGVNPEKSS